MLRAYVINHYGRSQPHSRPCFETFKIKFYIPLKFIKSFCMLYYDRLSMRSCKIRLVQKETSFRRRNQLLPIIYIMYAHVSSSFHWLLSSYFKTNKNTDEAEKEEEKREHGAEYFWWPQTEFNKYNFVAQMKYIYNVSTIRLCNITYFLKPANI